VNQPSGTLVSYGDSLALRFGNSMKNNPKITKVYQSCTYRYNWVYPVVGEKEVGISTPGGGYSLISKGGDGRRIF